MTRMVVALLLALLTTPAWAEWVKYTETADGSIDLYYDPATIKKHGKYVRVWDIQDLKQRHKDGKLSIRSLDEYDCKEERYRTLSISSHSERMAGGEVLNRFDYSPGKWSYIAPGTINATLLNIVCAK